MSIAKLVWLCAAICWTKVIAAPQTITSAPTTTVILYDVLPSNRFDDANPSNARPIDGTFQITVDILGISSGSAGSETTYSIGQYISDNDVFTTTRIGSQGAFTETVKTPDLLATQNWTMVESAGGEWETASPYITTDDRDGHSIIGEGAYQSCSFDSDGGASAICTKLALEPFLTTFSSGSQITTMTALNTFPGTFGGSKVGFTEITLPTRSGSGSPASTSSSNAGTSKNRQELSVCLVLFIFVNVALLA